MIKLSLLFIAFLNPCVAQSLLRIGMILEPTTLNPVFRTSSEEGIVNSLRVRSLTHFNAKSELVPHLAKSLPVFKKNRLVFEIRDDAKWDDGNPVTCEDFQTGLQAEKKFRPSITPRIDTVLWDQNTPKKCSIVFHVKKPIYTLYMAQPLPTQIEKKIIETSADEVDYLKNTTYTKNPTSPGLVNGPYKLSAYKPGIYMELSRNSNFYGKAAPFDKVQIRFYKDVQALINSYSSKEIEMIALGLTSDRKKELEKIISDRNFKSVVKTKSTTKLTHLEFNLEHNAVADVRVRKALSMMIDTKELALIIGGDGQLTGSLTYPNDPLFLKKYETPTYSLDRKKAAMLLKEAGYKKNEQGQLVDKMNVPLELNLVYNTESNDRERVAIYLENKWSSLGIKVLLKKYLKRVLFGEILKKGTFDVAVFGWSQPRLQINTQFNSIPSESNNWSGSNFSRWKNGAALNALAKADDEHDISKIKSYMDIFQTEFRRDMPWLPLYFETRSVLVPQDFINFEIFPDWEPETYEIENWK